MDHASVQVAVVPNVPPSSGVDALQLCPARADTAGVEAFGDVSQLVDGLCRLVEMQQGPTLAVGLVRPGRPPEVRVPPTGLVTASGDVATKVLDALTRSLGEETSAIGIVFPAARNGTRVEPSIPGNGEGHAVCIAARNAQGVGSVGLFRDRGGDWKEAHGDLDWLCGRLRLAVARQPFDVHESVTYSVGGDLQN